MTVSHPVVPVSMLEPLADISCVLFRREWHPDGRVGYPWISPNIEWILGYSADEMTVAASGALNAVHWAEREGQAKAIRESAASLTPLYESFRAIAKDGHTLWFRGSSHPRQMEDGRVEWEGAWLDITRWMRAEHEHQILMDHAEDSIVTIDGEHGIAWMNAAAERLFGYQLEEVEHHCPCCLFFPRPGDPPFDPTAPCDAESFLDRFPAGTADTVAMRKDGSGFPFEMTVSEVRRDGSLVVILIGRDITRRKITELVLEETRRSLRSVAANLPGAVFQYVREPNGHSYFPYFSEGIEDLLGLAPAAFVEDGAPMFEAILEEDRPGILAALTRSAASLKPFRQVGRVRRADGRVLWLRCHAQPRRHMDSVVWDGVLLDVTSETEERIKAETALRQSEERLRLSFAAASFGIAVVRVGGEIITSNPALRRMTGCDEAALARASIFDFLPRDALPVVDHLPPPGAPFNALCQPGGAVGPGRHWRITATQFSASHRDPEPSLLLFVEEVTEIVRAESERAQWELAMQESHKLEALGRLAGGVAHELNNMLGPILMGAEMIARTTALDDRNVERVHRVIDAAKAGRDIVRNVLAYCRKEEKILELVNVVPVFDQFASLAGSILPPTVKVEHRATVAEAWAEADPGQLHQVFLNLANNARDAMGGHGTLSLSLDVLLPGRHNHHIEIDPTVAHVEIAFTDTGCGMSKATAARIFDPFFTTTPVGQGTGLGLSVVQGIVKAMKGIISVDSEPGLGTTFTVLLPLRSAEARE